MRRLYILFTLLISFTCVAADRNGEYISLGRGTMSCGALVEARNDKDKFSVVFVSEWVNGYLTAINLMTPELYDLTEGLDLPAREQWLLKYCRERPLDSVAEATGILVRELIRKQ